MRLILFVPTGSGWQSAAPVMVVPPSSSPIMSSHHKRTASEADRWLEEVSKSVRAPQSTIPQVVFVPPVPPVVPMLPPRQPAFNTQAQSSYPVSNGLPFPQPSVPVFGITPSQMVANVFGSATHPQSFPAPVSTAPQHDAVIPFRNAPQSTELNSAPVQPPNGSATFNGADSWAAHSSPSAQPAPSQQEDAFEAQWAALESRTRQRTTPSPTNPFSTELQKTFEIQL